MLGDPLSETKVVPGNKRDSEGYYLGKNYRDFEADRNYNKYVVNSTYRFTLS